RFMESLFWLLRMHWGNEPRNWSAGLQPGAINVFLRRRTWPSWSPGLRFMVSLLSLLRMYWGNEPRRGGRWRASVLDCGSPLPLLRPRTRSESARGLAHSKTWRYGGRFMESRLSLLRMHCDHEPEMHKSLQINKRVFRFMES